MRVIKSVEIIKFRSIYKANIETPDITILSGKNNSGKSNVLKALNLFFKGHTGYDSPYEHNKDFNAAYTGGAGGRREILIRLNFFGVGEGKLKDDFSIVRTFWNGITSPPTYESTNEDTNTAIQNHDGTVIREFTRFYNKLDYIYVPAVRDKGFIKQLFTLFERVIDGDAGKTFNEALASLNSVLEDRSKSVSDDFKTMIGLKTRANLSTKPTDILEAIGIEVETDMKITQKSGERTSVTIDLFSNGDGILMSYVPHFLSYIARHQTNKRFIWGFEEPENSLEYSKAQLLAEKFVEEFSHNAQILLTTHSPAFIDLERDGRAALYRVYVLPGELKGTSQIATIPQLQQRLALGGTGDGEREILMNELGMAELAKEIEERIRAVQEDENRLKQKVLGLARPIIYSEGSNLKYLNTAKALFDPDGDYEIVDGGSKQHLKNLYDLLLKAGSRYKVIIIWDPDCDTYRSLQGNASLLPIVLPGNASNSQIKKGIEACMPEAGILAGRSRFYQTEQLANGGEKTVPRKTEIMNYFCAGTPIRDNFLIFEPVFQDIRDFLGQGA